MDCFLSCPAEIVFEKHARYNKKKADVTGEKIIRTLIIDDEPLLRQYIRNSIVSCDAEFEITEKPVTVRKPVSRSAVFTRT